MNFYRLAILRDIIFTQRREIRIFIKFLKRTPILKGWSNDKKILRYSPKRYQISLLFESILQQEETKLRKQ